MSEKRYYLASLVILSLIGMISLNMAQEPWTSKADMLVARCYFSTCVVDSVIYAIGGSSDPATLTISSVEIYNKETDTWTLKAYLPDPRSAFATGVVDGKIYIIGGSVNNQVTSDVILYDTVEDICITKAPMQNARFHFTAAVVDSKIYAIGGDESTFEFSSAVEMYDPVTDTWTPKKDMPTKRSAITACVVDKKIYVMGGAVSSAFNGIKTIEVYDPATDSWSPKKDMQTPRWSPSSGVMDGKIYVIGGEEGVHSNWPGLQDVEMYDPVMDSWESKLSMPTPRRAHSACVINGNIFVMGGTTGKGNPGIRTVEAYNPLMDLTNLEDYYSGELKITQFSLYQNYPNPFNPSTTIEFDLPKTCEVTLKIYNILGEEVATLVSDRLTAGSYSYEWDDSNWASGVYLYRLSVGSLSGEAGKFVEARKMVLMR